MPPSLTTWPLRPWSPTQSVSDAGSSPHLAAPGTCFKVEASCAQAHGEGDSERVRAEASEKHTALPGLRARPTRSECCRRLSKVGLSQAPQQGKRRAVLSERRARAALSE